MRKTKRRALVLGTVALLCIAAVYVSASYILAPAVSDQGGGAATSSSYELRGSIGGPVLVTGEKTAASPNYSLEAHSVGLITYREPAAPPPLVDGGGCAPPHSGAPGAPGASQAAGAGLALGFLPALWMLLAFRARRRRG